MSYSRSLQRAPLGNPYAMIVDAALQAGNAAAKAGSGAMLAAERNAKRLAQGKALELEGEKTLTTASIEAARAQAEAARIQAEFEAKSSEKNANVVIAGAAGLGVLGLLALVFFR